MFNPPRRPFVPRPQPAPSSRLAALLLAGATVSLPSAARAQTPPPGQPAPDRIIVTASPLDRSAFDLAQPVSSLSGVDLKVRRTTTLGDTLSGEPGIAASGYAGGASRPVIRGQSDNRVRVLQNGTDIFDVSNASPDHAPSVGLLNAQSVEVVRGAATILYGSGAIGGVVNVLDGRIPVARPANGIFAGELIGRVGLVDLERSGGGAFDVALGKSGFVFHLDGSLVYTEDFDIPGRALDRRLRRRLPERFRALGSAYAGDPEETVPNTFVRTRDYGVGLSYVWDKGYLGASFGQFLSVYGIPNFPEQVDPNAPEEEPAPDPGQEEEIEPFPPSRVRLDVTKRQGNVRGSLVEPFAGVRALNLKASYTDYFHEELDGNTVGSRFETNGVDSRLELVHQPFGRFEGSLGLQGSYRDLSISGAEAFVQPNETISPAAFFFEEIKFGGENERPAASAGKDGKRAVVAAPGFTPSLRLQFGGRVEYVRAHLDNALEGLTPPDVAGQRTRQFVPLSAAAGAVWEFAPDTALALTVNYSERAPTTEELFAFGPHDATGQFEVGSPGLGKEKQFGLDVSLRKRAGFVTGTLSGFYNRFYDYVAFAATGEVADEELPVFLYSARDADFFGGEAVVNFHLLPSTVSRPGAGNESRGVKAVVDKNATGPARVANPLDLFLEFRADYVQAEDRGSDEPLPRITPLRYSAGLGFTSERFSAKVEGARVHHQFRTAPFETSTQGFTFLNANVAYTLPLRTFGTAEVFLRGTNLLDEQGRNHLSFLKDVQPLPGRNVVAGLRLTF